jgi:hypothetical protein
MLSCPKCPCAFNMFLAAACRETALRGREGRRLGTRARPGKFRY